MFYLTILYIAIIFSCSEKSMKATKKWRIVKVAWNTRVCVFHRPFACISVNYEHVCRSTSQCDKATRVFQRSICVERKFAYIRNTHVPWCWQRRNILVSQPYTYCNIVWHARVTFSWNNKQHRQIKKYKLFIYFFDIFFLPLIPRFFFLRRAAIVIQILACSQSGMP